MDSHVFQPWQIRELVALLDLVLDSSPWCLGHSLVHSGVISVVDDRLSAVDFDDADGLWMALCSSAVQFAGKWAEVMDTTLAHARTTDESVSFLYAMCYVCARDGDTVLHAIDAPFVSRLRVDPTRLLDEARRGVAARTVGKRKADGSAHVDAQVIIVAPFLETQSKRIIAPRIARETPSPWV